MIQFDDSIYISAKTPKTLQGYGFAVDKLYALLQVCAYLILLKSIMYSSSSLGAS